VVIIRLFQHLLLSGVDDRVTGESELEWIWKDADVAYSKYYPDVWLEGMRRSTEVSRQDSWCPHLDSNHVSPVYKHSVLQTHRPARQFNEGVYL
jgi:hypothetical protein